MITIKLLDPERMLNKAVLTRGDTHELIVQVASPIDQTGSTLKLLCKPTISNDIAIQKTGNDWTISIAGEVLTATTTISPADTAIFLEETDLIFELERTLSGKIKTLFKGSFTITPDLG